MSRIDQGSRFYTKDENPLKQDNLSILWCLDSNWGGGKKAQLFEWNGTVLEAKIDIDFDRKDFFFRTKRKERDLEKEQTQDQIILDYIMKHEKKRAGDIKLALSKELGTAGKPKSTKSIQRKIKPFIDKKWIELQRDSEKQYYYNILNKPAIEDFISGEM